MSLLSSERRASVVRHNCRHHCTQLVMDLSFSFCWHWHRLLSFESDVFMWSLLWVARETTFEFAGLNVYFSLKSSESSPQPSIICLICLWSIVLTFEIIGWEISSANEFPSYLRCGLLFLIMFWKRLALRAVCQIAGDLSFEPLSLSEFDNLVTEREKESTPRVFRSVTCLDEDVS